MTVGRARRARRVMVPLLGIAVAVLLGACGFDVRSADVLLLTRTGQGTTLTLLINDGGSISCDGGRSKPLVDSLLIRARDLAVNLSGDATANLHLPAGPGTIFTYRVKLQAGTVVFSDRDTVHHPVLAETEVFAAQTAQQACNLN
ncbi:MAG: hypothetical protein ABI355_00510 [Solirubrobacteraceae bacterium]